MLQLGALICLGLFAVTVVSRLRFLGARAAGPYIALLGGVLVLADAFAGTMAMRTMLHPAVLQHPPLLLALYYLAYAWVVLAFPFLWGSFWQASASRQAS